ncbi:hypothetical protein [Natronolimnobius baerhuensis]|uniref:Uncharacterized protein n=1 Tax=Natronolimnobius baerhuensis TaxID=253108 RepID=A0A202EAN9_9EURY|nr:hypothetical protein [Natronolimnobius baerhuensis]OVE85020.1 hypothetical protein B2G88_11745 [Natronolimnobius baerhuensis]
MDQYALPAVGAIVALIAAVNGRVINVFMEFSSSMPTDTTTITQVTLGGRFVTFVFVYGVLFGFAYVVGTRFEDVDIEPLVLLTGAVAALASLVGTVFLDWWADVDYTNLWHVTLSIVGGSVGTGIQLAVVAFAGIALAQRRT